MEEACDTAGNSAWDPDAPVQDPADLGYKKGFKASYWYASAPCPATGCAMEGDPGHTGTTETINFTNNGEFQALAKGFPADRFAAVWNGKMPIYEAGEYTFYTKSDDGSILWIDGYSDAEKVVDNWGLHGAIEKNGTIKLSKGWHEINVEFFENGGGASCTVHYKGPDTGDNQNLIHAWHDPATQ